MTQRFSCILKLNLSILLLQLQARGSLFYVTMDKRKQEFSDDDFETPGAGAGEKKKMKMHEGVATAFPQRTVRTSKKQPRRVMTTFISTDIRALREDDEVVTTKHPRCFPDKTDADVATWEKGITQLVSSFCPMRMSSECSANAQQTHACWVCMASNCFSRLRTWSLKTSLFTYLD